MGERTRLLVSTTNPTSINTVYDATPPPNKNGAIFKLAGERNTPVEKLAAATTDLPLRSAAQDACQT